MVRVTYEQSEMLTPPSGKTNVIIAAFKTSYARVYLYQYLSKINRRNLYCDTDSIIYQETPDSPQIDTGYLLGNFKNELKKPSDFIKCFVGTAPKSYGFETYQKQIDCKCKGFTLNYNASQKINLKPMIDMIANDQQKQINVTYEHRIKRSRYGETRLNSVTENKTYKMTFDKRILMDNHETLPFGYKPDEIVD